MNKCASDYQKCLSCASQKCSNTHDRRCIPNLSKWVCDERYLSCLGDVAHRHGGNNIFPFQNAKPNSVPYVGVNDMDDNPPQCGNPTPFSLPKRQLTFGAYGAANRMAPYQPLHAPTYGGTLREGKPPSRDPLYY